MSGSGEGHEASQSSGEGVRLHMAEVYAFKELFRDVRDPEANPVETPLDERLQKEFDLSDVLAQEAIDSARKVIERAKSDPEMSSIIEDILREKDDQKA